MSKGSFADKAEIWGINMALLILLFVFTADCWCCYGYSKGQPYGLGSAGFMYGLMGLFGIRRLNRRIDHIEAEKYRRASKERAAEHRLARKHAEYVAQVEAEIEQSRFQDESGDDQQPFAPES